MSTLRPVAWTKATYTPSSSSKQDDNFTSKLIKYIPSESVALYTAIRGMGIGADQADKIFFIVIFIGVLILTPLWMYFATKDNGKKYATFHTIVATVAFCVWVANFGDIFEFWLPKFNHFWAAILLAFVTAIIPLLERIFLKEKIPAQSS